MRLFARFHPSARGLAAALTAGLIPALAACGDDAVGPDGDPEAELVLEGQVEDLGLDESTHAYPSNNPSLGDGTIGPNGSFTVTLFGLDEIESELEEVDPDASVGKFRGFACEEEAYDVVGSEIRFAIVNALGYGTGFDVIGLASDEVDITSPLPLAEGSHVRWIFAEEPVTIEADCRDGDREMSLDLVAGWNEVSIEVSRPGNVWFYEQRTGERPDDVTWMADD